MKPSFLLIVLASIVLFSCNESKQEKIEKPVAIVTDHGSYVNPVQKNAVTESTVSSDVKVEKTKKRFSKKTKAESKVEKRASVPIKFKTEEVLAEKTASRKTSSIAQQKAMDSLYAALDKSSQVFMINTSRDTTLTCAEGTIINIPAYSFADKSRKRISGIVKFEVKEYYAVEDMLFASLNSVSDGNLLESGGMLYMKASQNDTQLDLMATKQVNVKMPTQEKINDMQLFYGEGHDHTLNWKQSKSKNKKGRKKTNNKKNTTKKSKNIYYSIDRTTSYSKKNQSPVELEHIKTSTRFATDVSDLQDTVVVTFKIDSKGRIKSYRTVLNKGESGASAAARVGYYKRYGLRSSYHFVNTNNRISPGKDHTVNYNLSRKNTFHGIPVTRHSLGISNENIRKIKKAFRRGDSTITVTMTEVYACINERSQAKAVSDKIQKLEQGKNVKVSKSEIQYYVYDLNNLGWINCDRFYEVPQAEKTTYRIAGNNTKTDDVKIIFTDMKSIMQGINNKRAVEFENIPEQMDITVIGIRYNDSNSKYEFATSKTTTSDTDTDLRYFPVSTITEMKEKIAEAVKVN